MDMPPTYELYTYYRSSCSARVRIAAHLKGVDLKYKFVHLVKNEQTEESYTRLNPSASVPTLIVTLEDGSRIAIRQSIAILEYIEESRPDLPSLLPPVANPEARAKVRELVNIIACDVQPVTNLRILNKVEPLGITKPEWAMEFMSKGLSAYEALASTSAGKFSVGDEVTMADVVLAPAVDGALRFGVNMRLLPTIQRIYETVQKMESFQRGGWKSQPDTPEEFRGP